jgi:hypothetical protein
MQLVGIQPPSRTERRQQHRVCARATCLAVALLPSDAPHHEAQRVQPPEAVDSWVFQLKTRTALCSTSTAKMQGNVVNVVYYRDGQVANVVTLACSGLS